MIGPKLLIAEDVTGAEVRAVHDHRFVGKMRPMAHLDVGVRVQTPLGKGTVREVLNRGRVLVDIGQRSLVLRESEVSPLRDDRRVISSARTGAPDHPERPASHVAREFDLHGLTVEEALVHIDQALNDALLADAAEIRVIHGKSGGRIRDALHMRLRAITAVKTFRLDPRNPGVTVVSF